MRVYTDKEYLLPSVEHSFSAPSTSLYAAITPREEMSPWPYFANQVSWRRRLPHTAAPSTPTSAPLSARTSSLPPSSTRAASTSELRLLATSFAELGAPSAGWTSQIPRWGSTGLCVPSCACRARFSGVHGAVADVAFSRVARIVYVARSRLVGCSTLVHRLPNED